MRSRAIIDDVFAALISVFYWLQNQYVLHQTPIEIKSNSIRIYQTLANILPQKSYGAGVCPTVKNTV
jgi:hypothetical protein